MLDIVYETKSSHGWVYLYIANHEDVRMAILMENEKVTERSIESLFAHHHTV
jgi:hypothetical protein